MIREFVALFVGASWLSWVSEPDLKLGSYVFLTKCLSFSDHLLTPEFWHCLLGSGGTGSRGKQPQLHGTLLFGHRRYRCTCPILISAGGLKETMLMVPAAWYSSVCHDLAVPASVRWDLGAPCACICSFISTDYFPVKKLIPRVNFWLA